MVHYLISPIRLLSHWIGNFLNFLERKKRPISFPSACSPIFTLIVFSVWKLVKDVRVTVLVISGFRTNMWWEAESHLLLCHGTIGVHIEICSVHKNVLRCSVWKCINFSDTLCEQSCVICYFIGIWARHIVLWFILLVLPSIDQRGKLPAPFMCHQLSSFSLGIDCFLNREHRSSIIHNCPATIFLIPNLQ